MRKHFLTLCITACCGMLTTGLVGCGDDDGGGGGSEAGSGGAGRAGGGGTAGRAGSGGTGGRAGAGGAGVGGSGGASGADAGVTTTVAVTIEEFTITAAPVTAPAGEVTFEITNHGDYQHEVVVLKTDIAPLSLPIVDGEVNEDAAGIDVIDEIEEIAPEETKSLTVTLGAGKHVLICNLTVDLDDGGVLNHYVEGMATGFLVE
jgi:copper(I)-binding protein